MDFLTTAQVAAELQVSIETARRLIRSGALPAASLETPPGRAGYRIRRADLTALLDARTRRRGPVERDAVTGDQTEGGAS